MSQVESSYSSRGIAKLSCLTGSYNLVVEWHGGLPNKPATSPMLVLEYSYVSDMVVPSPSVPSSPRTVKSFLGCWQEMYLEGTSTEQWSFIQKLS